jgi:hypothetical protein
VVSLGLTLLNLLLAVAATAAECDCAAGGRLYYDVSDGVSGSDCGSVDDESSVAFRGLISMDLPITAAAAECGSAVVSVPGGMTFDNTGE